ncbi:uncharacterized protein LOC122044289 [Zingiber officinale]|uniref:uncharacterized protein LOC122044289 n=1 Tax=Zingiber officinale TaxID=94328 RepID=UPI001C4D6D4B|nr:uncharacterized protein LOC122044289 [Zingiber officinale]
MAMWLTAVVVAAYGEAVAAYDCLVAYGVHVTADSSPLSSLLVVAALRAFNRENLGRRKKRAWEGHSHPFYKVDLMDKSWIDLCDSKSAEYVSGVNSFLEFAFRDKSSDSQIVCPWYKNWTYHGEPYVCQRRGDTSHSGNENVRDDMVGMLHEAMGIPNVHRNIDNDSQSSPENIEQNVDDATKRFFELLKDAESELYPGCVKFTKLSFIVRLLLLKVTNGWTDTSIDMLLQLLKEVFPEAKIPTSFYEAQKLNDDLGFTCETIDACPNNSSEMKWHAKERVDDGVFRHPADSLAWKQFDVKWPEFASDSRNVRLGLASDGFNPFRTMNIAHSTWPVVIVVYNLPPWLCMTQSSFILSILVDGPKSPGNKIDVYMQPLIDDLKELWSTGVPTYDASTNEMFELRATLLWTISDFPAYAMLSGWSTKGELRRDKVSFNGKIELDSKPSTLSGVDSLRQLDSYDILTEYKKEDLKKRRRDDYERQSSRIPKEHNWKKKSIFFELEYWQHNLGRHNIDVMHTERNNFDNLLFTCMSTPGKTKDNLNARRDLKDMGVRGPLHPQESSGSTKIILQPGSFAMSRKDKEIFCKVLKNLKVPDGYASNISRRVNLNDRSIWGLKSHDCHIFMQQLLPIAIRRVLPKNIVQVVIELSNFFRQLCSKVNTRAQLEDIQERIALTLCNLERIFPPSFFDIMEHLPIHLVEEALICGAVHFRWMYPIERMHMSLLAGQYPRAGRNHIQRIHNETFHEWFKNHIRDLQRNSTTQISDVVKKLACGPDKWARSFNVCIVNGFRFRTKSYEESKATQNSGVMLRASTLSFASARDRTPHEGQVIYYGVLTHIIKVRYTNDLQYTLFKCDWIDNERGKMEDEFKFTLVNFSRLMYGGNNIRDEPFILSSQAEQCWYVADPIDSNWNVVMRMSLRDNFDIYSRFHDTDGYFPQPLDDRPIAREQDATWVRQGVEAIAVDTMLNLNETERQMNENEDA